MTHIGFFFYKSLEFVDSGSHLHVYGKSWNADAEILVLDYGISG